MHILGHFCFVENLHDIPNKTLISLTNYSEVFCAKNSVIIMTDSLRQAISVITRIRGSSLHSGATPTVAQTSPCWLL